MHVIPEGDLDSGTETMPESDSDPEDGLQPSDDADAVFDGMIGDIMMNVSVDNFKPCYEVWS